MRTIMTLTRLQLALFFKDNSTWIQSIFVPGILMLILSSAVNEESFGDVSLYLDVADQSQSELSAEFLDVLQDVAHETGTIKICLYGADNNPDACDLSASDTFDKVGQQRLEDQAVSAALIIPANFSDVLTESVAVEYRSDEQLNNPTIIRAVIDAAIKRMSSSLLIAQLGTQAVEDHFGGYADGEAKQTAISNLREATRIELQTADAVVLRESSGEQVKVGFGARQSVPGQGSMFVLFTLLGLSLAMMEEREQGTFARLLTLPVTKTEIVLGKIAGTFVFGVLQFSIFIGFGLLLGIDWGDDPLAVAALVVSFCLAGTALGFLVSTFVRTSMQAGNMVTMVGLILSPLGGAWWPLTIVPDFMEAIGHISPIAWLMDGFREVLYYQGGLTDVLTEVGVMLLFAAVFTTIAVWNFSYE